RPRRARGPVPVHGGQPSLYAVVQNGALRKDSPGAVGSLSGDAVLIASAPKHPAYEGRRLGELAAEWGVDIEAAAARIRQAGGERRRNDEGGGGGVLRRSFSQGRGGRAPGARPPPAQDGPGGRARRGEQPTPPPLRLLPAHPRPLRARRAGARPPHGDPQDD